MREIAVFENITIDGFMAGPKGEIDWAVHDPETEALSREGRGTFDTFMFGRLTYDAFAAFWPTPAGAAASPAYANALNAAPKIVFSRSLQTVDWQGSLLARELNREAVLDFKRRPGKGILILGSGSIVRQLAALDLIDEYQLIVNPVALGSGLRLFQAPISSTKLHLADSRTFKSGLVFLRYRAGPR